MTGQPDIAAALAWSGEAARAAANAQAALRGDPVPALLISSEPAAARTPLIRCRTCGNAWLDEQDCTCTCTDSKAPGYEDWVVLDAYVPGLEVNEKGWPTGNYVSPFTAASPDEVAEGAEHRHSFLGDGVTPGICRCGATDEPGDVTR